MCWKCETNCASVRCGHPIEPVAVRKLSLFFSPQPNVIPGGTVIVQHYKLFVNAPLQRAFNRLLGHRPPTMSAFHCVKAQNTDATINPQQQQQKNGPVQFKLRDVTTKLTHRIKPIAVRPPKKKKCCEKRLQHYGKRSKAVDIKP